MLTSEQGTAFAAAWVEAWNSHNLDEVMHHYSESVVFTSPFIVSLNNDPAGTITNKGELRDYFSRALQRFPDLHFKLHQVLTGVDSVVLYYESINNLMAAEQMQLNEEGLVIAVKAHYAPRQ